MATNALEPFDVLGDALGGSDGVPASHIPLHQRGRVLQQLREELRRRDSYSAHTRRVSTALLAQQIKRPTTTRHLLTATSDVTASGAADDSSSRVSLSPTAVAIATLNGVDTDAATLVRSAILALWTHRRLATGFRQWKEVTKAPTDLSRFGNDVDLTTEARRILLAAEAERLAVLREAQTTMATKTSTSDDSDDHATSVVLSPRVLDTAGVRLSRDELDLLTMWAKEMHTKTFRSVDDASIGEVMRCLRLRTYADGEPLFYEGETGETFYMIFQGTVGVFVGMPAAHKAALSPLRRDNTQTRLDWSELGKRVFTYRSGDCLGETAMLSADAVRTASAVAVGPCEVGELHKDVYRRTLSKYHQQCFEQAQKLHFLQRVPLFRELPRLKLLALADVLEKKRFHFGETLEGTTTERTRKRECFLVLSGVVKLTQSVDVPGQSHALTPAEAATSGTMKKTKKRHVAHMKIELQTVVATEIVGLEALLLPAATPTDTSGRRNRYTATAASAHVDVYVLKDCDARMFIGGIHSALGQQIQRQCEHEAAHRERRQERTQQTWRVNHQEAEDAERAPPLTAQPMDAAGTHSDSVDLAAASLESPRCPQRNPQEENVAPPPGLQVVRQPPAISEGSAPYLPHLRATHLFSSAPTSELLGLSPRDYPRAPSDLSVVSSPKMLSSCVRKFLFEHSDTLANDYADRLRHQFPTPPPQPSQPSQPFQPHQSYQPYQPQPLLPTGSSSLVATKTQRDDQRVLDHQLSKMYDSKMHWDAKKKDFVVAATAPSRSSSLATSASSRAGFLSNAPRCPIGRDPFTIVASPPSGRTPRANAGEMPMRHAAARRKNAFHQELQTTQQTARRLVEIHLKRVGGGEVSNNASDISNSGGASFLHFFADS